MWPPIQVWDPPASYGPVQSWIQGAGISQTVPNPDGEYPDPSGDFKGQGVANLVSGFFQGLPMGGSLGGTGIILSADILCSFKNP